MARNISLLKTRETYNRMYGWGNSVSGQASGAHSDSSTVLNSLKGKEGQFSAQISGLKPCLFLPDWVHLSLWPLHLWHGVHDEEQGWHTLCASDCCSPHSEATPHSPCRGPKGRKKDCDSGQLGDLGMTFCKITHVWASADESWGLYFYFLDCLKWGRT